MGHEICTDASQEIWKDLKVLIFGFGRDLGTFEPGDPGVARGREKISLIL
jgi:hypothetical protein